MRVEVRDPDPFDSVDSVLPQPTLVATGVSGKYRDKEWVVKSIDRGSIKVKATDPDDPTGIFVTPQGMQNIFAVVPQPNMKMNVYELVEAAAVVNPNV
jgi:hypothetical protein